MSAATDQTIRPHRLAPGSALARGYSNLTSRMGLSARELLLAGGMLLLLGGVVYRSHITHGNFYYDDWANAALTMFPPPPGHPGFLGALQYYFSVTGFRPLVAAYQPTVEKVLGLHQHMHIAWAVLLAIFSSTALYAALRTLRLERMHAFVIAALVLVFPYSDAAIMWSTASVGHLVTALYLVGLIFAVRGLRAESRRAALLYHAGSVILYVAAVTTYELAATVALASVAIYVWQSDWRRALRWFVVDLVAICAALAWTLSHSAIDQVHSAGGRFHHAWLILGQGVYVIARAIVPFGSPSRWLVVGLAAAVVLACALALTRLPRETALEGRRWLLIAIGGVLWAYIAWAVFVPADPYYEPTGLGVGNRTNVVAAFGLVTTVYALGMLVGTTLRSRVGRAGAMCLALAWAVTVGAGYVHRTNADSAQWNLAAVDQDQVLAALHREIPRPASHSTIFAWGFPNYTAPGVPVFAASWDLNGAVQLTYRNGLLKGYPLSAASSLVCGIHAVYPTLDGYDRSFGAAYGRAYLIDVGSSKAYRPQRRADCDAWLKHDAQGSAASRAKGASQ